MHPRLSSAFTILAVLASFSAVACATPTGADVDTDEGATTITPHGNDSPGKLQVVLPQGATNVAEAKIDVDDKNVWPSLGSVVGPLSVGGHGVKVSTSGPDFDVTSATSAKIASDQTTTLTTAVLSPDVSGAPPTVGLDASRNLNVSTSANGSSWMRVGYANGSHAIAVVGPSVRFFYGVGGADGVEVPIAGGDVKKVDVWDVSQRRRARLQAPASRDLPDARCGGQIPEWSLEIDSVSQAIALPAGSAIEVGLGPWKPDGKYTLTNSMTNLRTPLPTGARGAAAQVFAIGRIDVTDVQLSSGGTVKGTYQVRTIGTDAQGHPTESSNVLLCAPPTGTGVDLPPGKYKVVTTYQTVEAGGKSDETIVDLP